MLYIFILCIVYFFAVILLDGSVPIKYGLRLNSESKYFDLKRKLALLSYLNPNFMLICEIWNSQIRHIFPDDEKIKPSSAKELYCYQLPEECQDRSRSSSTMGINIEKGLKDIQRSSGRDYNFNSYVLIEIITKNHFIFSFQTISLAMLTTYDSYSSLNALNNSTNVNATVNNTLNNPTNGGDKIIYAEHSFDETLPPPLPTTLPPPTSAINVTNPASTTTTIRYQNSFDNVASNMTIVGGVGTCGHDEGDETEDDDLHVSTKVRRCFGNNMCMPQNLLCFKVWL